MAETVSGYFAKGRMAVVNGRLQLRDWTDKDGGMLRSAEIVAEHVCFGDSKPKEKCAGNDAQNSGGTLPEDFASNFECGELPL